MTRRLFCKQGTTLLLILGLISLFCTLPTGTSFGRQAPAALQITSPATGTTVTPGQTLSITVTSPAGLSFSQLDVIGEQPIGMSTIATATPAQFTLSIPAAISCGVHTIIAEGTTSSGQNVQSAGIAVDVERADLPASLAADTSALIFETQGQESSLVIYGSYADGTTQRVNESSLVTYASTNTNVAVVDSLGDVTAVGTGAATISVTYTLGSQTLQISIPATVQPPVLTTSPSALAFAQQGIGTTSSSQQISLTNSASGPITVTNITTGGDFSETDNCTSSPLSTGAGCTVNASFLPSAVGARTGTLSITNSANSVPILVALSGTGISNPAPIISGLSLTSGSVGSPVTISGANFGSAQGTSKVAFNSTTAAPTNWSASSITAPVPTGAATGNVVVTVGGQASNGVNFTVTANPAPVQQASNSDISGNYYTSFSATFSSTTTTGNAIVLGLTYGEANAHISATDSFGNTYALASQTYDARHNQGSIILYALNIQGGASHTVTINADSSVAYLALGIHEYSGLASAAALDVAAGQTGTGASPSSGTATTAASNDLIFGVGVEDAIGSGDSFSAASGFTKRVDLGTAAAYADEDQMQASAGSVAAAWSLSPASDWVGSMAAFRPPGSLQGTAHVQQASNSDVSGTTYTSFTASFTYPTTAGNAVILGVTFGNTNPTITATDNEGNSYAVAQQTYDSAHNQGSAILYALNIHGGSSHTVTVNFSNNVAYLALGINEYTGLASSSALDTAAGRGGSGTSPSSGTATTTANGDLIFGVGVVDSSGSLESILAGTGFTKRVDLGSLAAYSDEDQVQTSAGSIAATWTLPVSQNWIASVAAFKPKGGN